MIGRFRNALLRRRIRTLLNAETEANPVTYNRVTPYQGYRRIGLDGARVLEDRFQEYGLAELLQPRHGVLDIGSNTGFFVTEAALTVRAAHGVEPNPQLNAIGAAVSHRLGVAKLTKFFNDTFEAFLPPCTYDVVLSLAAFHTADGRERSEASAYFGKIDSMLNSGGTLVYESTGHSANDDPANPFGTSSRMASESAASEIYRRWRVVSDETRPASNASALRRLIVAAKA